MPSPCFVTQEEQEQKGEQERHGGDGGDDRAVDRVMIHHSSHDVDKDGVVLSRSQPLHPQSQAAAPLEAAPTGSTDDEDMTMRRWMELRNQYSFMDRLAVPLPDADGQEVQGVQQARDQTDDNIAGASAVADGRGPLPSAAARAAGTEITNGSRRPMDNGDSDDETLSIATTHSQWSGNEVRDEHDDNGNADIANGNDPFKSSSSTPTPDEFLEKIARDIMNDNGDEKKRREQLAKRKEKHERKENHKKTAIKPDTSLKGSIAYRLKMAFDDYYKDDGRNGSLSSSKDDDVRLKLLQQYEQASDLWCMSPISEYLRRHSGYNYTEFDDWWSNFGREQLDKIARNIKVKKTSSPDKTQASTISTIQPQKFARRLMAMMQTESIKADPIVIWNEDGDAFHIANTSAFEQQVMPLYSGMSKWRFFQEKLLRYHFVSTVSSDGRRWYSHSLFRRDDASQCEKIAKLNGRCAQRFPVKLMAMMRKESIKADPVVIWNEDGDRFHFTNIRTFEEEVMPSCCGMSKWKSFQDQLYKYGFVNAMFSDGLRWYSHPLFRRDDASMCLNVERCPRGISDTSTTMQFIATLIIMTDTEMKTAKNPLILWDEGYSGDAFFVADPNQFTMQVLPKYTPTVKTWNSFRQRLWRLGFNKTRAGSWTHPLLDRKMRPEILQQQQLLLQKQPISRSQSKSQPKNTEPSERETSIRHQKKRKRPSSDVMLQADSRVDSFMLKTKNKDPSTKRRTEPNAQACVGTAANMVAI